jgi:hypothetical protein
MRGEQKKNPINKIWKVCTQQNPYRVAYWRKVHCCVNILAQEYPSIDLDFLNKIQNRGEQFAAFCLFMGKSLKNRGLKGLVA